MKFEVSHSCGNYWYIWVETYQTCWLLPDGTITSDSLEARAKNWRTQQEAQGFLGAWMPRERKLTVSDVSFDTQLGEKEALDSSIEHWKQNVLDVEKACLGGSYCAICVRAERQSSSVLLKRCVHCIVNNYNSVVNGNCCKEYEAFCNSRTEENAIAMLNKLVLIRNEKYGNREYGNSYDKGKQVTATIYDEYVKMNKLFGGSKMANRIVFDDGKTVELSKETTERLRKELVKPKVEWKHGDIALSYWVPSTPKKRLILIEDGKIKLYHHDGSRLYCSFSQDNIKRQMDGSKYEKIGNLFDDFNK